MLILVFPFISTTKAWLHSEDIRDLKLMPHGYSSCRLFAHVVRKSRVFERKEVAQLRHDVRKDSGLVRLLTEIVSIHKNVLFAAVSMQVTVQHNLSFFFKLADESLNSKVFGVQSFVRILPPPIQILTDKTTAVVPIDHTVWVQHRHYLKYKVVSQYSSLWCLWR